MPTPLPQWLADMTNLQQYRFRRWIEINNFGALLEDPRFRTITGRMPRPLELAALCEIGVLCMDLAREQRDRNEAARAFQNQLDEWREISRALNRSEERNLEQERTIDELRRHVNAQLCNAHRVEEQRTRERGGRRREREEPPTEPPTEPSTPVARQRRLERRGVDDVDDLPWDDMPD